jgi:hypothetical protein
LINTLGMKVGSERAFSAGYNILPVWKKRLDAKTLVTTPSSDVIYAMSYLDLGKDGPMVFEAPPGLQGILLDFWRRPIRGPTIDGNAFFGDVGLPGPDAGRGGKFLILPPGYDKPAPDGYFVCRSGINNVFVFLRSFYQGSQQLDARSRVDGSGENLSAGRADHSQADAISRCIWRACEHAANQRRQRISISSRCLLTAKGVTSPHPIGSACWRRLESSRVSLSIPTRPHAEYWIRLRRLPTGRVGL